MDLTVIGRQARRHLSAAIPEILYLKTRVDLTRPIEIRAKLTNQCNYKCLQCACWRMADYSEISIDQWMAALASIKEFLGPYTIQFVGGEPFVKKGFLDLLSFCRRESIDFGVITNGSAFVSKSVINRFVEAHPLKVEISVDGPTPEIHDRLRGIPGSLLSISAGIHRLLDTQRRLNIQFPLRIKATLNSVNFRAMPDLVTWAMEHGATTIDIEPIREWTDESKGELWPSFEDMTDLESVIANLIRMKRAGARIETSEPKMVGWMKHFRREKVPPEVSTCRVGTRVFSINPVGMVRSCDEFSSLGDVTRDSARDIWTGESARKLRRATVECTKGCAYGCMASKSTTQKIKRGLMVFGNIGFGLVGRAAK
jgi:MoaA/NifB/PqqE/SkfB family radical SAM enzyme